MHRLRFERLVRRGLRRLPPEMRDRIANVEIVVEEWPDAQTLADMGLASRYEIFGLYQGTPLTSRGSGYTFTLPDKISIFQGPIEAACDADGEVVEEVAQTVIHEVAHHFGIDDERLHELGVE